MGNLSHITRFALAFCQCTSYVRAVEFGGYEFARETLSDSIISELEPLTRRNWTETGLFADVPLDMDWHRFLLSENMGILRLFTACKAGELVGYAAFFFTGTGHHKSFLLSQSDVLFIAPEHRGFGADFIAWCDVKLWEDGSRATAHSVRVGHDFSPVLKRQGYVKTHEVWVKRYDAPELPPEQAQAVYDRIDLMMGGC